MQVYMLKDIARLSGHSIYTIKFYLKLGLIQEIGRSPETGFRYFDESTLKRMAQIRSFRKQGRSLAQIQVLLEEDSDGTPDSQSEMINFAKQNLS